MGKFGITAFLITNLVMAQTEKTAESDISRVTVFLNRAQVTRQVKARVEAGKNTVVVRGLPAALDPQSLQVRAEGKAVLLGVGHRHSFINELLLPPELKKLKDSINFYNRQLMLEQQNREVLNKEEQMLLANQRIGGANQNLSVSELKGMADYFRSRLTEITLLRLKTDEKTAWLKERLEKLNRQYSAQNELYKRNTSEVVISLLTETAGPAELELSYVVNNAGWQPVYDIRALNAGGPVQLHYRARVHQSTGEDWKQVKLKLSTANPASGGVKPELDVWYLDFLYPPTPRAAAAKNVRGDVAEAPDEEVLLVSDEATLANYTQAVQTSLNTEFDIGLPYTVTSSTQPVTIDIQRFDVPATYRYAAVPLLDNDAFLQAHITGWEEYNLMPGEAQVFFEGTYVGKTYINPGQTTDTLSVSMGRDPRLIIKREQRKDFTTRKTMGSNIRQSKAWNISLRNTRTVPVTIMVEDHVPVSRNSQIEVTLIDSGGARYNKETGKLSWELTLQPNESKTVGFAYEVKYPKGRQINY
ncbi:MAG: hypothetical protein KatS3mg032_1578 [Cyclobacteriaceae bacterium]|nr:MAG: hypothetical protein KatS3mg032_1578 [Cyclobacteriaceae bacterium]